MWHLHFLQNSQEESNAKGRRMVGLSASRLESDLASGQKPKEGDDLLSRRRKTFFWDIQRMVITSAAPNLTHGQQRRSLVEYRKPEAMSKERAMTVLGLGVRKVKKLEKRLLIYIFTKGRKGFAGSSEAE